MGEIIFVATGETRWYSCPEVYKTFSILNSDEHESFPARKC